MMRRKLLTCDFKGCDEIAPWCGKWKGELFKLCTEHEAYFARKHWSKRVDASELDEDDIRYLEGKERRKELAKKKPFEVRLYPLEDGAWKVKIRDRRTDERRSFILKDTDRGRFDEAYRDFERKESSTKPSIDDYVKKLRKEEE